MNDYLGLLVSRLLPQAAEISAYLKDGEIDGYAKDASGALLDWPMMAEFEAEWVLLQAELSAPPAAEPSVAELQAQIAELQQAMIDLLLMMGGG